MSSDVVLLPTGAGAPGTARRRLASLGHRWAPEVLDVALLLTTELVTNAVRHAAGTVCLCVDQRPAAVRIEVSDGGTRVLPARLTTRPGMPAQDALGGRGLPLVDVLARRWGSRLDVVGGQVRHAVWFELATTSAPGGSVPSCAG